MACCQPGSSCSRQGEAAVATLRIFENLPGIGHVMAAVYGCCKDKDRAERAALKATIGIVLSVFNFTAEAIDESSRRRHQKARSFTLTDRRDWMTEFHHMSMDQLCLPGSHQSGTGHMHKKLSPIPMSEGWSRCQIFPVSEQLVAGIRFLDLRVMTHDGEIWLHHNVVICEKLQSVMEAVQKFVEANPSEVVGVHINNDGKEVDWGKVHQIITETVGSRLLFEHDRRRPIGDVVKDNKNVAIFDVPNVAYAWRCLENRWPNKSWPDELAEDLEDHIQRIAMRSSPHMYWYKAECTPNAPMIVRLLGGIPGLCARRCAKGKFEFLEDLAAAVNYQVLEVLNKSPKLPFNVLSTDFVHDDVIEQTIRSNTLSASSASAQQNMAASTPEESRQDRAWSVGAANKTYEEIPARQIDEAQPARSTDMDSCMQGQPQQPMQIWVSNV